uniref:Uncharacterized protein n=1 Tax=Isometrus maculatus TaxID=497827 RepID=A0A0U1SEX8_ISOMC|nr:hypothetical protein [Isometrus maculatus]
MIIMLTVVTALDTTMCPVCAKNFQMSASKTKFMKINPFSLISS